MTDEVQTDSGDADDSVEISQLADTFGLEYITATTDDMLDTKLVGRLPVDWARSHLLLPVRIAGELCVLTCDPAAISDQDDLALLLGQELRPVLAPRAVILKSIERCYFSKNDSAQDFLRDMDSDGPTAEHAVSGRSEDLLGTAQEAPITQLINLLLLEAVKRRASDIHFEPFESELRIRYRIDGVLYQQASPPKHMQLPLVSRLKVMARMDIAEKRLPQDGMAKVRVGEREIDIRVSTVPVAEGERVVLRLLDRGSALLPMGQLGMSHEVLARFQEILRDSSGLILVTGPTGSGKTTTLYASLQELSSVQANIMTIEDPIEYQLPSIGQIQVKPKIGLTFVSGLAHILRQDPDVILIGETRDAETAETAARSSLTGHLVLTTLHTNDAPSAVIRMIDMGIEPYLLAASLRASLAQRLVRQLCPKCRREVSLGDEQLNRLGGLADRLKDGRAWEAVGCPECLGGYKGRVGIYELMVLDAELRESVRLGECSVLALRNEARKRGMTDLLADGLDKVSAGLTSLQEVLHTLGQTGVSLS